MKNPSHNKRPIELFFAVHLMKENDKQIELIKKLFSVKYKISPKKVRVDKKYPLARVGIEYIGMVVNPTVAQLKEGKKHVNYNDFIAI